MVSAFNACGSDKSVNRFGNGRLSLIFSLAKIISNSAFGLVGYYLSRLNIRDNRPSPYRLTDKYYHYQVHLIDFDDETNIVNKSVFLHTPGEVWDIDSSSSDKCVLATCYNTVSYIIYHYHYQVHLIDFDDETNIVNKSVFLHTPGEVWDIDSSSSDKCVLATCYNTVHDNHYISLSLLGSFDRLRRRDEHR